MQDADPAPGLMNRALGALLRRQANTAGPAAKEVSGCAPAAMGAARFCSNGDGGSPPRRICDAASSCMLSLLLTGPFHSRSAPLHGKLNYTATTTDGPFLDLLAHSDTQTRQSCMCYVPRNPNLLLSLSVIPCGCSMFCWGFTPCSFYCGSPQNRHAGASLVNVMPLPPCSEASTAR
jgi:hypothetical protein